MWLLDLGRLIALSENKRTGLLFIWGRTMATRGKGEGSIYQRTNGTWACVITLEPDSTGKRNRKWVYGKTKKEVTEKLTRLQNQKLDGTVVAGRMTVGDLLDKWLADSAKLNTDPNTYTRYESVSRLHLKPAIGATRLSQLKPMHVSNMLSTMERNGVGQRTRGHVYAILRRALNIGMKWDLLARNVCQNIDPPKQTRATITTLTDAQVTELLSQTGGTRWSALFMLAITTGLRQGELFALRWEDIDLQRGVLSVRHSLEEINGKLRLKEPKSKSGKRQVTLSSPAIKALKDHKAMIEAESLPACDTVFQATEGGFLRKSNFERRVWKKYRDAAGISDSVTFHSLRHTHATILLGADTNPKIVQERLGHSSIQLTMDTYSHIVQTMQQDVAAKLDHITIKPRSENNGGKMVVSSD
jgi:integrase